MLPRSELVREGAQSCWAGQEGWVMPSQWAEKHECLFWSRSTGFSFRGAGLSLPLLADAWGASGLPPDLCSLPACGTLEMKMWLPITQPTPPLSHAPVNAHTPAHTHGCSQTLHPSCPTPPAAASLCPATLCPPLPSSPAAAPLGPCHSHGGSHTPSSRWGGKCHCQVSTHAHGLLGAVLAGWHQEQARLPLVPSDPTQPRPSLLAFPLSVLNMREDMCLYDSPSWDCFMCLMSSCGEAA